MTNAEAWKLILGDVGHFLCYFGVVPWIALTKEIDRAPSDGRYFPGVFTMVAWVWVIWDLGAAARYWG